MTFSARICIHDILDQSPLSCSNTATDTSADAVMRHMYVVTENRLLVRLYAEIAPDREMPKRMQPFSARGISLSYGIVEETLVECAR